MYKNSEQVTSSRLTKMQRRCLIHCNICGTVFVSDETKGIDNTKLGFYLRKTILKLIYLGFLKDGVYFNTFKTTLAGVEKFNRMRNLD